MVADQKARSGPVTFALTWLGAAVAAIFLVGVVAGLIRGDVPATLGPVVMWGMLATSVAVVVALFLRGQDGSDRTRD